MINVIQEKYRLVKHKGQFIRELAEYMHMKPGSIRNHWFSNDWAIPEEKQERCLLFLDNYLRKNK